MTDGLEETAGDGSVRESGGRTSLETYAELVRVPNLFTAPPDVLLGTALVAAAGATIDFVAVAGLAAVSVLLYAGGTTLNDAFDAPVDAVERPERPIPSGRVSRRTAFAFGFGLLAVAVVLAFAVAGLAGGTVAGLLAAAVVAYDGLLKGTNAGFLAMGTTRGLNVVLGTTVAGSALLDAPGVVLAVPFIVAVYIAAVTSMAARETGDATRGVVVVAAAGAVASLLVLGWYLVASEPTLVRTVVAVAFAGAFCWWIGRPLYGAYVDPRSETIGPAVGACILGLVLLDSAFAAITGLEWALVTAAFLLPAVRLSRLFDVT